MTPDPTDADLDEWERQLTEGEWAQSTRKVVSRLTKALRACRQRSTAKAAVIKVAGTFGVKRTDDYCAGVRVREIYGDIDGLMKALAALDKEPDDANG